jgi:hypothetical protein
VSLRDLAFSKKKRNQQVGFRIAPGIHRKPQALTRQARAKSSISALIEKVWLISAIL